jgi:transcriptional regulator GlxA family with amidase domain
MHGRTSMMLARARMLAGNLIIGTGMKGMVDPRITATVALMQQRFGQPIPIVDLAAAVNLSPSRFRHLFTSQVGVGPAVYLQRLRLRRARLLIERTFLSVKEVMALVGYNDPSHFSRDFRRLHGVSPRVLRRAGIGMPPPPEPGSSVNPPTHKRIRQHAALDPETSCP